MEIRWIEEQKKFIIDINLSLFFVGFFKRIRIVVKKECKRKSCISDRSWPRIRKITCNKIGKTWSKIITH